MNLTNDFSIRQVGAILGAVYDGSADYDEEDNASVLAAAQKLVAQFQAQQKQLDQLVGFLNGMGKAEPITSENAVNLVITRFELLVKHNVELADDRSNFATRAAELSREVRLLQNDLAAANNTCAQQSTEIDELRGRLAESREALERQLKFFMDRLTDV